MIQVVLRDKDVEMETPCLCAYLHLNHTLSYILTADDWAGGAGTATRCHGRFSPVLPRCRYPRPSAAASAFAAFAAAAAAAGGGSGGRTCPGGGGWRVSRRRRGRRLTVDRGLVGARQGQAGRRRGNVDAQRGRLGCAAKRADAASGQMGILMVRADALADAGCKPLSGQTRQAGRRGCW
jgi:hypothetical protein